MIRQIPVMAMALAAVSLVSVQQEIQIGKEAQQEMRRQVPELRSEPINAYIDTIGAALVRHAPGNKYPYSFSIADYKEINAFALPGGPVWIHRGAMSAAQNEAQLAGVLAHEVAHIAQRHTADQLTKQTMANGLLGLLGAVLNNGRGEAAARLGAGLFAQGLFLKFSRDDEREADRVGMQIMRKAGWDPHGMIQFMQILADQEQSRPSDVQVFLSSHPAPADRARELQSLVGSGSGRTTSARFQTVQQQLDALPPAKSMPRQ
jgi:predicted Zn-dependent protease